MYSIGNVYGKEEEHLHFLIKDMLKHEYGVNDKNDFCCDGNADDVVQLLPYEEFTITGHDRKGTCNHRKVYESKHLHVLIDGTQGHERCIEIVFFRDDGHRITLMEDSGSWDY